MSCEERLRWYEQRWEEDWRRWEKEKKALQQRLDEQTEEILALKKQLAGRESVVTRTLEEQIEDLRRRLEEEENARKDCQEALRQTESKLKDLSHRPLGESFFRYLEKSIDLWDQKLLEEVRHLQAVSIGPWLKTLWREREEALSRVLLGGQADWRRLRTALVLEWALLAWLEGAQDA
ncbi:hypothetical protein [Thermus oshimai]